MANQNKWKLPQDLQLTDDQLQKKLKERQNQNTVRSEKKAHQAISRYLLENGAQDLQYWVLKSPS